MGKKLNYTRKGVPISDETRLKLRIAALKRKHTPETKEKIRQANIGPKSPRWKGGIYPEHLKIRHSNEMKLWRKAVFERDKYTCIWCYKKGIELHADHIKPFSLFPELRFAIDNGRTLCVSCHKTTDTYGSKAKLK